MSNLWEINIIILFLTAKGCRVYIDHDARVYQNWKSYLTENKLPKGVLVVPKNGEYRGIILNVSMLKLSNSSV